MPVRSIEQLVSARSLKAAYAAMRSGSRVTIDLSPLRAPLARELKNRAREITSGGLSKRQLAVVDKSVALELHRIQNFVIERVREDIKEARQTSVSEGRLIVQEALTKAGVYGDNPYVLNTLLTTFNTIIINEQTQLEASRNPEAWGYRYVKNTERHAALHNATLPKNDIFWNIYTPPNGYGCQCTLEIIYEPVISYKPTNIVIDEEFRFKPQFLQVA